ncbi:hypothetical protein GCM10027517_00450 [Phycicoccus ginsengisoli]
MTADTTHPLAAAYLRDLELLLHGIDAGERAEVLAGVREHLDAVTGPGATDDDVRAALAELGPPQAIADEAYAGRPGPVVLTPPAAAPGLVPPRRPALSGTWVPVVVGVLQGLCLVWTLFVGASLPAMAAEAPEPDTAALILHPVELLVLTLLGSPWLWIPAVVLTGLSPLWRRDEKLRLALTVPAVAVLLGAAPWVVWRLTGSTTGVEVGVWTAVGAGLALATWVFWHDLRAGARRARELA